MRQRTLLVKLVRYMFAALFLVFAVVLVRSLGGPSLTTSVDSPFDDVEIGETTIRRYEGERVWVTRLSPQLIDALNKIDEVVINKDSGCKPEQTLCAVVAKTSVDGIEIRYSANRPMNISRSTPWVGGFVNPNTSAVYDILGRAYRVGQNTDSPITKQQLELVLLEQ